MKEYSTIEQEFFDNIVSKCSYQFQRWWKDDR